MELRSFTLPWLKECENDFRVFVVSLNSWTCPSQCRSMTFSPKSSQSLLLEAFISTTPMILEILCLAFFKYDQEDECYQLLAYHLNESLSISHLVTKLLSISSTRSMGLESLVPFQRKLMELMCFVLVSDKAIFIWTYLIPLLLAPTLNHLTGPLPQDVLASLGDVDLPLGIHFCSGLHLYWGLALDWPNHLHLLGGNFNSMVEGSLCEICVTQSEIQGRFFPTVNEVSFHSNKSFIQPTE